MLPDGDLRFGTGSGANIDIFELEKGSGSITNLHYLFIANHLQPSVDVGPVYGRMILWMYPCTPSNRIGARFTSNLVLHQLRRSPVDPACREVFALHHYLR